MECRHSAGNQLDKRVWCKEFLAQYGYEVILGNKQSGQGMPQGRQEMALNTM